MSIYFLAPLSSSDLIGLSYLYIEDTLTLIGVKLVAYLAMAIVPKKKLFQVYNYLYLRVYVTLLNFKAQRNDI